MREVFERAWAEAATCLEMFRRNAGLQAALERVTKLLVSCLGRGDKVLVCGNGGSMADAMHFAEEWSGRFRNNRRPYPVLALSDPAHLTCVSNDYGFEQVFSRQVEALAKPGDLLLVLTTSGNSANVIAAATAARERGVTVVALTGKGGGAILAHADEALVFPGAGSDRIQGVQMMALHAVIEAAEKELGHD